MAPRKSKDKSKDKSKANAKKETGQDDLTHNIFVLLWILIRTLLSYVVKVVKTSLDIIVQRIAKLPGDIFNFKATLRQLLILYAPPDFVENQFKFNYMYENRDVKWNVRPADLICSRLNEKGFVYFIAVGLNSMDTFYRLPAGMATTEVAHISLHYRKEFSGYEELFAFQNAAERILQGKSNVETWLHVRPTGTAAKPQLFLSTTCSAWPCLREIQDLLGQPRDPVNLHISCNPIRYMLN